MKESCLKEKKESKLVVLSNVSNTWKANTEEGSVTDYKNNRQ